MKDRKGRRGIGLHVRVTFADEDRLRLMAAGRETLSDCLRRLIDLGLLYTGQPTLEPMAKVGRPRKS